MSIDHFIIHVMNFIFDWTQRPCIGCPCASQNGNRHSTPRHDSDRERHSTPQPLVTTFDKGENSAALRLLWSRFGDRSSWRKNAHPRQMVGHDWRSTAEKTGQNQAEVEHTWPMAVTRWWASHEPPRGPTRPPGPPRSVCSGRRAKSRRQPLPTEPRSIASGGRE